MSINEVKNSLSLTIPPVWAELNYIRNVTREFLEGKNLSKNQIDALEMVACEMVENAIKYGDYTKENEKIGFAIDIKPSSIILEVKNKVNPMDQNLKIFDSRIQWIRSFQNPFQAYVERLKYVSTKQLVDAESGLGLTRIAYEGHSILDFYLNENSILAVSAIYKL